VNSTLSSRASDALQEDRLSHELPLPAPGVGAYGRTPGASGLDVPGGSGLRAPSGLRARLRSISISVSIHGPRDAEQWFARNLAWPLVLLIALLALVGTIARMSADGPSLAAPYRPLQASSGAAPVVYGLGPAPTIAAAAAYVFDADTGAVFYARHADDERAMASCTKIMTALVAVQRSSLDQLVTIGADAAAYVNSDNSYMGLGAGETLTLGELLYGLLLPSGNDAAVAIADAVGGTQGHFVAMMNQEAQALGLAHTHFANPHGLDAASHHTSARDLAILAADALRNPIIASVASTVRYVIPKTTVHKAFTLFNYNSLLPTERAPYPGAIGLKPGNTGAAGWCEAFAARRDGHLIVGVVLGDPTWSQRNDDMHALLDWGFGQDGVPPAG
jgi:serine-type D-Ala-D-Ala carboxypeptidase (penicillin-binding protein 5/6)